MDNYYYSNPISDTLYKFAKWVTILGWIAAAGFAIFAIYCGVQYEDAYGVEKTLYAGWGFWFVYAASSAFFAYLGAAVLRALPTITSATQLYMDRCGSDNEIKP